MLTLLTWLALHLGRRFIGLLLYPITLYFLLTASAARCASRQYLSRVLDEKPGWMDLWKHFYTFSVVSVDRLFFLSGRDDRFQIRVSGAEIFQRYTSKKQGCILLVSHVGSFDVMRVTAVQNYNYPIRILMDRKHNARAMEIIDALNPTLAETIINTDQSAPALALALGKALSEGALVGVMADRAGRGERVMNCAFLGGHANFPVGPWLLGMILRVPVVLCFGIYQGGNRYDLSFELFSEQLSVPRSQRDEEIERAIGRYANRLEYYASKAPYNWFNFYDFWFDESASDH